MGSHRNKDNTVVIVVVVVFVIITILFIIIYLAYRRRDKARRKRELDVVLNSVVEVQQPSQERRPNFVIPPPPVVGVLRPAQQPQRSRISPPVYGILQSSSYRPEQNAVLSHVQQPYWQNDPPLSTVYSNSYEHDSEITPNFTGSNLEEYRKQPSYNPGFQFNYYS